jgi:uncharacterized protein involved in exopolysaccharide biosynthesis
VPAWQSGLNVAGFSIEYDDEEPFLESRHMNGSSRPTDFSPRNSTEAREAWQAHPERNAANGSVLRDWLRTLSDYRWLLIIPTLALLAVSLAYATLSPKKWRATQVFHLRDEMIGRQNRPGHFDSLDDMKTAQETVLEIARNANVVRRCLQTLEGGKEPSSEDVEESQGAIQISASNGAELGKTELIRLSVVARTPERAAEFCRQLTGELETELRTVRYNRACSMVAELDRAVESAKQSLADIASQIEDFENRLGSDLVDLRNLIEPSSGENLLNRSLNQITTELRAAEISLESVTAQRDMLQQSLREVKAIVATPNEFMNTQPALQRLKEGLIDAQLKLATLRGEYNDNHPKVIAALETLAGIEAAMKTELESAIVSLSEQIQLENGHVEHLRAVKDETSARLKKLTEQRVIYDQLNEEFKRRDVVLRDAQAAVSQADSIKVAAQTVDLLTRVNDVQVSSRPEGISKRTLVGSTTLLGFFFGLGLVMLFSGAKPLPLAQAINPLPPTDSANAQVVTEIGNTKPAAPQKLAPRETVDQILDKSSFAVTVMPSNFLLSKPQSE